MAARWLERGMKMTGDQSRTLMVGDRVFWSEDRTDQGVITEKNWAGVTIKWDNRDQQTILHNDMTAVFLAARA
jgi:hypothetical protein